jgi:3-oxoacyl-[acyl-carrier protein] reductase
MRLNFEFILELDSYLVKPMMKKKFGRIVYISSISGMENHGPVLYCSAKAALAAYARSFGGVLAPSEVFASCLLPGAVISKKNFWDIKIKTDPKHVAKYLNERQRIGRFGSIKEISDFVIFLSSQYASFNTGSVIPFDGGQGRGYFGQ